jgi:hypothetical protein
MVNYKIITRHKISSLVTKKNTTIIDQMTSVLYLPTSVLAVLKDRRPPVRFV